jgi:hypothetical protein
MDENRWIVIYIFLFILQFGKGTRFFKVAQARHKGAFVVVKLFVLHDPTLPLLEYKEKLEFLNRELSPKNNCLPFAKPVVYLNIICYNRNTKKHLFLILFDSLVNR